jgi:hypothetical protein
MIAPACWLGPSGVRIIRVFSQPSGHTVVLGLEEMPERHREPSITL